MKDIHDFFLICLFCVFVSALIFLCVGCSSFKFSAEKLETEVSKVIYVQEVD